jgi:hypothetical protein
MLKSFESLFDYSDFEKKLKHYFSDTSPIYAEVSVSLQMVCVIYNGLKVQIPVDGTLGVKENVNQVILSCESFLYPRMIDIVEQPVSLSEERVKELLLQGLSLDQIHAKQIKKVQKVFIITRFNTSRNSLDFKEEATNKIFRAYFNRPLVTWRDTLLGLADDFTATSMHQLYTLIINNARIEELEDKDAIPTDSD